MVRKRIGQETLVGVEVTFQNRELYNERVDIIKNYYPPPLVSNQAAILTRFFNAFLDELKKEKGVDPELIENARSGRRLFSPDGSFPNAEPNNTLINGIYFQDPRVPANTNFFIPQAQTTASIHKDPRVFEFISSPQPIDETNRFYAPIYRAARRVGLVPQVHPLGIYGGGGQVNIGSEQIKDNPFLRYPNLLRNLLVFFHTHPSLLFGFGEPYDLGNEGTAEPWVGRKKEAIFAAIEFFDTLYTAHMQTTLGFGEGITPEGVSLTMLFVFTLQGLIPRESFINIERLYSALRQIKEALSLEKNARIPTQEKYGNPAVEIRALRMFENAAQLHSYTSLIGDLMEKLSEPGLLIPYWDLEASDFTGTAISADWEKVKTFLGKPYRRLDGPIAKTVKYIHRFKAKLRDYPEAEIFPALHALELRSESFEIRIDASIVADEPLVSINGKGILFDKIDFLDGKSYWVAYVNARHYGVTATSLRKGTVEVQDHTPKAPPSESDCNDNVARH